NSGDWNSGNWNSGNRNSGNRNSGDWNSGNCNSGYFNSNTPAIRIFNKDTTLQRDEMHFPDFLYFDLTLWISHDTATDEEKETHKKEIEVCGGFLKTLDYKDAFKIAYDKASKKEHIELFKLPNFDCSIFEEISGINTKDEYQEWMKGDKKNG
ncbi:MAG: pentapeptide repeat-containing protein, partial [archaeon]|nr:pentapeptide repeat-containing protein [archaeon]